MIESTRLRRRSAPRFVGAMVMLLCLFADSPDFAGSDDAVNFTDFISSLNSHK